MHDLCRSLRRLSGDEVPGRTPPPRGHAVVTVRTSLGDGEVSTGVPSAQKNPSDRRLNQLVDFGGLSDHQTGRTMKQGFKQPSPHPRAADGWGGGRAGPAGCFARCVDATVVSASPPPADHRRDSTRGHEMALDRRCLRPGDTRGLLGGGGVLGDRRGRSQGLVIWSASPRSAPAALVTGFHPRSACAGPLRVLRASAPALWSGSLSIIRAKSSRYSEETGHGNRLVVGCFPQPVPASPSRSAPSGRDHLADKVFGGGSRGFRCQFVPLCALCVVLLAPRFHPRVHAHAGA